MFNEFEMRAIRKAAAYLEMDRGKLAAALDAAGVCALSLDGTPEKQMPMGRVFWVGEGTHPANPHKAYGWYYQINLSEPVGPFDTQLDAGKAARATIVAD